MKIKLLTAERAGDWNAFVERQPQSTFFHLAEWKIILEEIYKLPTYYLYAERDGHICAILPLAYVKSRLFSNVLASTPFCVYGGVVGADATPIQALEDRAMELARLVDADYLQLNNDSRRIDNWPCSDHYYSFEKTLSDDHDTNLQAVPRKQRAMIRKGLQTGLRFEYDSNTDRFYPIYALSVRNLGTPVYPRAYFQALKQTFGDRCLVNTVSKDVDPICSVLSFVFKNKILPYYAGGQVMASQLKAYDYMYWQLMCYACDKGLTEFDFGRIKRKGICPFTLEPMKRYPLNQMVPPIFPGEVCL